MELSFLLKRLAQKRQSLPKNMRLLYPKAKRPLPFLLLITAVPHCLLLPKTFLPRRQLIRIPEWLNSRLRRLQTQMLKTNLPAPELPRNRTIKRKSRKMYHSRLKWMNRHSSLRRFVRSLCIRDLLFRLPLPIIWFLCWIFFGLNWLSTLINFQKIRWNRAYM